MEEVQVSVVIPTYNVEQYVDKCLDSISKQTLYRIEIICVDDGSADTTLEILESYAQKDKRFRIFCQKNAGPGVARNLGLSKARGKYVIFLDSDDYFETEFLETMLRTAEDCQSDVTICCSDEFDSQTGEVYTGQWMLKLNLLPQLIFNPKQLSSAIFQFSYGWPWDKLYRRAFIAEKGLSYPVLLNSEDVVFVFPSLAAAEKIAVVPKTFVHHRVNRCLSVSNSRHLHPEAPCRSIELLSAELKRLGCYDTFEASFAKWIMEFLIWNSANMPDQSVSKCFYLQMKQRWLKYYSFSRYPIRYYGYRLYAKYLLARWAPYPLFSFAVWGCHKMKEICWKWKIR